MTARSKHVPAPGTGAGTCCFGAGMLRLRKLIPSFRGHRRASTARNEREDCLLTHVAELLAEQVLLPSHRGQSIRPPRPPKSRGETRGGAAPLFGKTPFSIAWNRSRGAAGVSVSRDET